MRLRNANRDYERAQQAEVQRAMAVYAAELGSEERMRAYLSEAETLEEGVPRTVIEEALRGLPFAVLDVKADDPDAAARLLELSRRDRGERS